MLRKKVFTNAVFFMNNRVVTRQNRHSIRFLHGQETMGNIYCSWKIQLLANLVVALSDNKFVGKHQSTKSRYCINVIIIHYTVY
jgi:hypothetical protein